MARSKKTRKVGDSSPKLKPRQKKSERMLAGKKRDTGHKSGTRHNEHLLEASAQKDGKNAQGKDPRHGSKNLIPLVIASPEKTLEKSKTSKLKLTDEQQLVKLENDPRLNQLLDMLEEGRELNSVDQLWLDKQLDKIERLLTKLGISEQDDANQIIQSLTDDELLTKFESAADMLKDYQQK